MIQSKLTGLTYDSVTSGIEAATVAWHPLGWKPGWFSEIAPFPCRLLQHYYPHVPNYGDMYTLIANPKIYESTADILVGGTPCQDFSIAGLRGGLAGGKNSNLALEFCRLLIARRYRWFIWENVPGVLTSYSNAKADPDDPDLGGGSSADFATLLAAFRECGYSCAWRVLDAQYFGVPQRRRRVFVVGYLGDDWRPPAAVLFEPEGLRGYPAAGGQEGQTITGKLKAGAGKHGEPDVTGTLTTSGTKLRPDDEYVVMSSGQANAEITKGLAPTLSCLHESPIVMGSDNSKSAISERFCPTLQQSQKPIVMETFQQSQYVIDQKAPSLTQSSQLITGTLAAGAHPGGFNGQDISNGLYTIALAHTKSNGSGINSEGTAYTLDSGSGQAIFREVIRRLTPLEWERLQGFPDHYTKIPGASDSPRYAALGNSMAVPVMRWIGKRLEMVDKIFNPHLYGNQ